MSTIAHTRHTILRNGQLLYNRRVPANAQERFGSSIRVRVDSPEHAEALTTRLDSLWKLPANSLILPLEDLVNSCRPRQLDLLSLAEEYLDAKGIQRNPTHSTAAYFTALVGNRDVADYTRQDARLFITWMLDSGRKTTSARRRVNCLTALFNYAYKEFEIDRRNPFSGLLIPKEGKDKQAREPFNVEQLQEAYSLALGGKSRVRLCVPVLGETGCRIAEIIGLRQQDIDLQSKVVRIRACGHSGFPSWLKSDSSFQNGGLNERRAVCVDR